MPWVHHRLRPASPLISASHSLALAPRPWHSHGRASGPMPGLPWPALARLQLSWRGFSFCSLSAWVLAASCSCILRFCSSSPLSTPACATGLAAPTSGTAEGAATLALPGLRQNILGGDIGRRSPVAEHLAPLTINPLPLGNCGNRAAGNGCKQSELDGVHGSIAVFEVALGILGHEPALCGKSQVQSFFWSHHMRLLGKH